MQSNQNASMKTDARPKLDPSSERYALARAYVPEHIPALMATISQAAPFLVEDYLGFAKDNWVIFVGYPLETPFDAVQCDQRVARALELHRPDYLWFIGPEIPPSLARACRARQSDRYYRLDLAGTKIRSALERGVKQAARTLTVEQGRAFTREHRSLADELMRRETLPPMIAELYRAMPDYVARCESALVLNARDARGRLAAFFVVECAAEKFDAYVLGCHSKKHYVPHASDLLFFEMIAGARQRNKPGINLGLGVNPGIRRFKTKWGGVPTLEYEFCECYFGAQEQTSILDALLDMKF
ncbi:MAG: hypothetical protein ACOYYJ_14640 [Chloroflexota bacterium]